MPYIYGNYITDAQAAYARRAHEETKRRYAEAVERWKRLSGLAKNAEVGSKADEAALDAWLDMGMAKDFLDHSEAEIAQLDRQTAQPAHA